MIINDWKLYNNSNLNLIFLNTKDSILATSEMTPAFWVYFEYDLQKEEIIEINPELYAEINKDNKTLLAKLRKVEKGPWKKVYKDGYIGKKKVSVHYFQSKSGLVYDVKTKSGWSNK
ncbi:hypothetical protein [Staphylococcus felis]|uniref:hypothetical protein n=1 Tax=Staphylococcus felis TaxID=46127 RepID=UPI001EE8446E|nr:hypothetical protein [Staphylococcus felis]